MHKKKDTYTTRESELECEECKLNKKSTQTYTKKALNDHRSYMRKINQGHKELKRSKYRTEVGDLASLADFGDSTVTAQAVAKNTNSNEHTGSVLS